MTVNPQVSIVSLIPIHDQLPPLLNAGATGSQESYRSDNTVNSLASRELGSPQELSQTRKGVVLPGSAGVFKTPVTPFFIVTPVTPLPVNTLGRDEKEASAAESVFSSPGNQKTGQLSKEGCASCQKTESVMQKLMQQIEELKATVAELAVKVESSSKEILSLQNKA